jgi:hypothetical protein
LSQEDIDYMRPYFEEMQKRLQSVLETKGGVKNWVSWDLSTCRYLKK